MNKDLVQKKIEKLGHRIVVRPMAPPRTWGPPAMTPPAGFQLNINNDKKGEFFDFQVGENTEMTVLDTNDVHALILFKTPSERKHNPPNKERALVGLDERQLYIAGISEGASVSTVSQAMESLKPREVQEFEKQIGVKKPHSRKAKGKGLDKRFRQGDFFFIPRPELDLSKDHIHKKEPIGRTGGSNHICDELIRTGGENFYIPIRQVPGSKSQYNEKEYQELLKTNDDAKNWGWNIRRGGISMKVYVRGGIRHHEHNTLTFNIWHEVISNTELDSGSSIMSNIAFLD